MNNIDCDKTTHFLLCIQKLMPCLYNHQASAHLNYISVIMGSGVAWYRLNMEIVKQQNIPRELFGSVLSVMRHNVVLVRVIYF